MKRPRPRGSVYHHGDWQFRGNRWCRFLEWLHATVKRCEEKTYWWWKDTLRWQLNDRRCDRRAAEQKERMQRHGV